ncbi:general transcription factor 3C polypeptide 1 [Thrips palmi]|uniref:General transcription factor 3C polypeptide 1 n=1 Tax=Thrips palmi TaxID=161013 RepID=A0A6P8YRA4_THRPL|nr:general transcription factor 3C polypeptide 1 [Thrips palmi]
MFGQTGRVDKELSSRSLDYTATILDEIALEGLDGITLQGLWVRLGACPHFPMAIDQDAQKFIWEVVKRLEDVDVFELPTERSPLVLFNRFELVDHELGNVIEPEIIPEDIYPFKVVDDQTRGIIGSCPLYDDRREITERAKQATLEAAIRKWGSRLVLVASQSVRSAALMGDDVDPCLELTPMHFCILERIGRARYHGEVTQGKISLHCTGEDPKSLFYYRKTLLLHKLITKQGFNLKSNAQNCSGSLLHLPRFFSEHKSKIYYWTERIVEFLRGKVNFLADYEEVRNEIGGTTLPKKLFKTPDFLRFVKSEKVTYRTVHPDAPREVWKNKGSDKEKLIRVVRLVNPNCSVKDEWVKEEEAEEEEEGIGYVDESTRMLDVPIMTQAFNAVDEAGPNGLTQVELSKKLGMTKLQARTLCRNLLRRNLVSTFMNDVGRQRFYKYCSKRFDSSGHLSQEFHKQRDKMLSLLSKPSEPKRKPEDDLCDQLEKRRRIEEANGFCHDESMPSHEEIAPLLVECVKMEFPDIPFMEAVPDDEENGENAMIQADFSESINQLLAQSNMHQSTPLLSPTKKGRGRKRKTVTTELSLQDAADEMDIGNPTEIVIAEDVSFIETKDNGSFTDEVKSIYGGKNKHHKESPAITTRVLKRVNLIIEAVQQHIVIEDLTKLLKLIHEEEEKEGLSTKIDRKSLHRLLEKLNKDGHIKTIRVHMKGSCKEKTLNFVCQPGVTVDHSLIQSALDQAKMKMFIPNNDRLQQMMQETRDKAILRSLIEDPNFKLNSSTIDESLNEMSVLESSISSKASNETTLFKRNSKLGKKYGYQPKFVRMKTMHKLLFYLIHDYAGVSDIDQLAVKETLNDITPLSVEIENEMPQVYFPAVDWRMFIPPLPQHSGWPKGWAIMCDILLRLPLSIFLHLVNINYEVSGLDEYLSHPIRKHYLLKHLPPIIRNQLTAARRYIFNCHEVVSRLCYIGLVQFGPQKLKEKDQVFIYLNKNTSLMDTTTSPAGYHQISRDLDYKVLRFHFGSFQDVDQYWYQLWYICVNTSLGGRMCVSGKEITVEVLENKPAMEAALQARTPEEAAFLDGGDVPGDHCGAAGLDSALFSHLKRNWNWFNHVSDSDIDGLHTPVVNDHLPLAKKSGKKVTFGQPSKTAKLITGETLSPKNFVAKKSQKPEAAKTVVAKKRSSKQNQVRKVPLPKASRKKPYYDDIDLEALALMSKLRVEWTAPEDNILLLCKVASSYLSPQARNQCITMQTWRNLLHRVIDSSKNKTSRAVQRRIVYMMKNPSTARSVSLCLEEIKQDPKINKVYGNLLNNLKSQEESPEVIEQTMNDKFSELVDILQGRFQNMRSNSVAYEKALIPDTVEELRTSYVIASPQNSIRKKGKFADVAETADIHASVINAMIYSSLCCMNDKTNYAYQLFGVYQQYPDALLRSTMAKIRSDQMVSLRRPYARTKLKSGQFLPVSNCPYQLSISYQHLLQTKFQYEIFSESFVTLQKLAWDMLLNTDVNGLEFLVVDGGSAATFIEYIIMDKVRIVFQITIPDQLIILDPRISRKDETYNRIVDRYRDILRKCKVSRDLAKAGDPLAAPLVSAGQKPFLDMLSSDDVWNEDAETESDSEPSSKKRKTAATSEPATSDVVAKRTKKAGLSELDSESDDEDYGSHKVTAGTPQIAVARAATRIALYMMREENEQTEVNKVQETQHAHDFFVVNSCKVVCRLKEDLSSDAQTEPLVGIDPSGTRIKCAVSRSLLPVNAALANDVLENIKKRAVFEGPNLPENVVLAEIAFKGIDESFMLQILEFCLSKNEFGATMDELRNEFENNKSILAETLESLVEAELLLRAGVTKLVIVHYKKVRPWLIHSSKLLRLDKEKLNPTDGKVLALSDDKDEAEDDSYMEIEGIGEEVPQEINDEEEEEEEEEEEDAEPEEEVDEEAVDDPESGANNETEAQSESPNIEPKKVLHLKNARTKRGKPRLQESSLPFLDELDNLPANRIRVSMRPWIRVDGTVNRRVLDRLLGAVLGHCMSNPGYSLDRVGERFSPGLQPFHTRELCEVLRKLGCITWKALVRSHKPTLFTKPRTITLVDADGTECESDICLEACADAILRLGLFIGDKAYKKDFFL